MMAHIDRREAALNGVEPTSSISIIMLLPPEILGEIFSSCVSSMHPLQLAAICKFWQTVVHGTPRIWTFLRLRAKTSSTPEIALTFQRAGSCSVDVIVDHASITIASALSIYAERIRSLTIRGSSEEGCYAFLAAVYSAAGNKKNRLRSLHIRQPSSHDPAVADIDFPPMHFPLLVHLEIPEWRYTKRFTASSTRTLQNISIIEPLSAAPLSPSFLLYSLQTHPKLTHFQIKCRIDSAASALGAESLVSLPALTHLRITTNDVHSILSKLFLPALQVLEIIDLDGRSVERSTGTALLALLSRGILPPIRHLCLVGVDLPSIALCFPRLPCLEKLILEKCFGANDLVEPVVFPKLKTVQLRGEDSTVPTKLQVGPKVSVVVERSVGYVEESAKKLEEIDLFHSPPPVVKFAPPVKNLGVRRKGFGFGSLPRKCMGGVVSLVV